MKNFLIIVILAVISLTLIPIATIKGPLKSTEAEAESTTVTAEATHTPQQTISVFRSLTNTTEEMDMFEYVCGSVAAEMPLAYHEEALKAQAVACYTNALRMKEEKKTAQSQITGEKISDGVEVRLIYDDIGCMKTISKKYEAKLQSVVKAVENQALFYKDELCVAAFFAISSGNTEDAKNIWGGSVPYLKSVTSEGDRLSPQYASTIAFDTKEFTALAEENKLLKKEPETLENIIKIEETSPTGTVLKATVNGKEYTGEQIRKAFSLRSPVFTIKTTADTITFSVCGYGHGVGMSQYGADYLAKNGNTYKEILTHYYTGAEIKLYDVL